MTKETRSSRTRVYGSQAGCWNLNTSLLQDAGHCTTSKLGIGGLGWGEEIRAMFILLHILLHEHKQLIKRICISSPSTFV